MDNSSVSDRGLLCDSGQGCLQTAWDSLLSYTTSKYGDLEDEAGQPNYWAFAFLTAGVPWSILMVMYWFLGLALMPCDYWQTLHEKVLGRKCQPTKVMTYEMVRTITFDVLVQQLTVYPLALLSGVSVIRSRLSFSSDLPDWQTVSWQVPVFLLATEVWFYYVHRLLHHKSIYRFIHKKHHIYKYPLALEALYFHPIETVANFGVVGAGPLLCGSHVSMLYLWTFVSTTGIMLHHCGYEIPFDDVGFGSMTQLHDFHHAQFDVNFGVLGLLDRVHGTDTGFAEYWEKWTADRVNGSETWNKSKLVKPIEADSNRGSGTPVNARKPAAVPVRRSPRLKKA